MHVFLKLLTRRFCLLSMELRVLIACFSGVHVSVSKGGSMSASLLEKKYIPHVWQHRPGAIFKNSCLLFWDSHASHKDQTVATLLQQRHESTLMFIPPGMTPLLQPLDVAVNKVLKWRINVILLLADICLQTIILNIILAISIQLLIYLPLHPFGGIGKKNLTQAVIYDLLYLTVQIFFNLVNQGCTEW